MKRRMLVGFLVVALGVIVVAQEQTAKPAFNEELAQKLGADEYGMRSYVFCLLTTGDADTTDKEASSKAFAGHFANLKRHASDGKLVLAGPFSDPERVKRGLFIFNVATIDEAKQLVETDPAVAAGYLNFELTQWYGSAALLQVNEIHPTIAKSSF